MQVSTLATYRGVRQPAGQAIPHGEHFTPILPHAVHERVAETSSCDQSQNVVNMDAAPQSVVLFAKALTASDCCTSVSKGGRITIPRVAVEKNLPSVADRRHHEVVRPSLYLFSACHECSMNFT